MPRVRQVWSIFDEGSLLFLLALLIEEPMSVTEIQAKVSAIMGIPQSHSRFSRRVPDLIEEGLIEPAEKIELGAVRQVKYKLTPLGKKIAIAILSTLACGKLNPRLEKLANAAKEALYKREKIIISCWHVAKIE